MNTHSFQFIHVLDEHLVSDWQDMLLHELACAGPDDLRMRAQRAAQPRALALEAVALAQPLLDLVAPRLKLPVNALCKLLVQRRELVGERALGEAELRVEGWEVLCLCLDVCV